RLAPVQRRLRQRCPRLLRGAVTPGMSGDGSPGLGGCPAPPGLGQVGRGWRKRVRVATGYTAGVTACPRVPGMLCRGCEDAEPTRAVSSTDGPIGRGLAEPRTVRPVRPRPRPAGRTRRRRLSIRLTDRLAGGCRKRLPVRTTRIAHPPQPARPGG